MSEGKAMRDQFAECHDELLARGEKLEWKSLRADARYVALLEKEVELARSVNDATFYELCFDDVGELTAEVHDVRYEAIEREMLCKAAELGSAKANLWLGHEYRAGKNLPRDFEKAYSCYLKGKDFDWAPIDPEDNSSVMEDRGGEVDSDFLMEASDGDIDWWLFLLAKHPNRSIKCGIADWYMKQDGDENREKALKLFEQSANEGFEFAFFRLIEFYSKGEFKDLEKGRYWFEKAVELGFDEACFANELGVESLQCRKLKEAADSGDSVAAAKLACAYLHGVYDGGNEECVCCVKDLDKARHYGVMACMGDDGGQMLVNILDDHIVEDQKFLSEVAQEAGLE